MGSLSADVSRGWMDEYSRASRENDPKASSELFANGAHYYETPFAAPIIGRPAIYERWAKGARALRDKQATYEIPAIQGNQGIARWQFPFTSIETGTRHALDRVSLVDFDETETCSLFRERWHMRTLASGTG